MRRAAGGLALLSFVALFACGLDVVGTGPALDGGPTPTPTPEDAGATLPEPGVPDAAGGGDATIDPPVSECGDVLTSENDCGACGHSCGGRGCTGGLCNREPVAALTEPRAIAVGSDVFIANPGVVQRFSLAGVRGSDMPSSSSNGSALTLTASRLVVGTNDTLAYYSLGGGSGDSATTERIRDVVASSTQLFYSRDPGEVRRNNHNLTSASTISTANSDPFGLALDDNNLYWVDRTARTIVKAPLGGGGGPAAIVNGQDGLHSIATDATSLYWTTATEIRRSDKNGGGATTLVTERRRPRSLVHDQGFLYWIDGDSGRLERAPTTGGTPLVLAQDAALPANVSARLVAVTATHVYWASPSDGRVSRLPK
ncbi:MAG: hypothetical protein KIT84_32180 [Labilithrix sp.]|nr:hypothetical protein [Labilithrix sp.]MCW5815731.1 hypothetical protein [Labilithrix sp.]